MYGIMDIWKQDDTHVIINENIKGCYLNRVSYLSLWFPLLKFNDQLLEHGVFFKGSLYYKKLIFLFW